MKTLSEDHPVVLGLAGKAGTGKTTVGNILAPQTQFSNTGTSTEEMQDVNADLAFFPENTIWDHKFLAMPLYKLVSIKDTTEGYARDDRVLYQIHEVLTDIFSGNPLYGAPPYSDLIKMTEEVARMPLPAEGKPRKFLQDVGTMCRDADPDCFVKWTKKSIYADFMKHKVDHERRETMKLLEDPDHAEAPFMYVCVVSDVRMENEARLVAEEHNGVLVRFDASLEVRMERLVNRDGAAPQHLDHPTEQMAIPEELFDAIIDTDEMNPVDQALDTRATLMNTFGLR